MITIEQLKDWTNNQKKEKLISDIEKYIDGCVQREALKGNLRIKISTGRHDIYLGYAVKTKFYDLWCNNEVSKETLGHVREVVINKYREIGLHVDAKMFDEGWNTRWDGVWIEIPKELLSEDKENE